MLGAESALLSRERAPVERFRLGEFLHLLEQHRQIIQTGQRFWMSLTCRTWKKERRSLHKLVQSSSIISSFRMIIAPIKYSS
jgi:hypothetical protein